MLTKRQAKLVIKILKDRGVILYERSADKANYDVARAWLRNHDCLGGRSGRLVAAELTDRGNRLAEYSDKELMKMICPGAGRRRWALLGLLAVLLAVGLGFAVYRHVRR
jgi:hypothetical protein